MKNRNAQIISLDMFVALFIFLIVGAVLISVSSSFRDDLANRIEFNELQITSFRVSEMLVKTKGVPSNWEENLTTLKVIGLAENDRDISPSKLDAFVSLDYNSSREVLGVKPYNFYLKLEWLNGTIAKEFGASPSNPTTKRTSAAHRIILYKNEKAKMEFVVWS